MYFVARSASFHQNNAYHTPRPIPLLWSFRKMKNIHPWEGRQESKSIPHFRHWPEPSQIWSFPLNAGQWPHWKPELLYQEMQASYFAKITITPESENYKTSCLILFWHVSIIKICQKSFQLPECCYYCCWDWGCLSTKRVSKLSLVESNARKSIKLRFIRDLREEYVAIKREPEAFIKKKCNKCYTLVWSPPSPLVLKLDHYWARRIKEVHCRVYRVIDIFPLISLNLWLAGSKFSESWLV